MKVSLYESVKPVIDFNTSIRPRLQEICRPLFDNFDITYFEYDQIFNDGKVFYLCTNKEWLQFSLENRMFDDEEHVRLCSIAKARNYRYALWHTLKLENTQLLSNYFQYDVWNGLTINVEEDDSFNIYSFATAKNNTHLNEFFLNNLSLFDHFIVYFRQKLKDILNLDSKSLAFNASPLHDLSDVRQINRYNHKISEFLKQTALTNFEVKLNKNKVVSLSKREIQCLHMLSEGKTMKEIGNQLDISTRTVEVYINSLRNKTGLTFKNELITFYEKSPLKLYKYTDEKNLIQNG